ncbi:MAG TPA: diguanylate cyclase, partial [Solirubrobacteraceae bacterium]|nr:diguanylate cyclase [Solirubrobacteraceae bacterium]
GTGGLDGLDQLLGVAPGIPVVVLSGADDERLGLAAVRRGAQDYATKCERDAAPLWRTINRAIERAHVTRELIRRANQDSLTGLPNRALFVQRVDQAIARSRRWATGFTVIFVEVDDFKSINDNFGHATGDDVLREISRRFLSGLGDGDTPCRYAGVAFAAICHAADRADATRVARRVQESICREPVVSGVRSFKIGVSIGVALGAGDDHAETLMHRVDGAIYEAKLTGAVCVVD